MTTAPPAPPAITPVAAINDPGTFTVEPHDVELFDKHLRSFVPPGTFDAHGHWYDLRHLSPGTPVNAFKGPVEVGYDVFRKCQSRWMGDRAPSDGLFFPFPSRTLDRDAANRFLVKQLENRPNSRGLMMIGPTDDPAAVEAFVVKHKIAGFKPYHVFAARTDTQNADQGEFLPEWAWEIAQRHGLWITMHMVLARSLADAQNQRYIREHCLKYPEVKYNLAHAARGFAGHHTVEGIDSLRGLDNVYFDTSVVCEPSAIEAVIRVFGTSRLVFGSDFAVSEMRARAFNLGDGFFWIYGDNPALKSWPMGKATLAGIESLLAVKQACHTMRLSDSDVERIFIHNAKQLLGITKTESKTGQALYREGKAMIPGGTQLLSKRPELFAPERWPAYYQEARGCEVVDLDGKTYIDMTSNGIGACLLGYADPDVTNAVVRRVTLGSATTLNNPEEVELARLLLELHPWAQSVRYGRGGGEAMSIAARIARAATGREKIAFCGYHGWTDWYLAANLESDAQLNAHLLPGLDPAGVPASLRGTALPFAYNKLDELKTIVERHGKDLAAVVMEPTRSADPEPGFLEGVRELCDRAGAKLVFDEITVGFRLAKAGAHMRYGISPDMAVYAKALGNGHPVSAVVGKAETMQAAQGSFISSTNWTEGVGFAAAVATLRKLMRIDAPAHVNKIGLRLRAGWQELGKKHKLPLKTAGHACLGGFSLDHPDAAALMTLYTVRLLDRGYLAAGNLYATMAHTERHIDRYLEAIDPVFAEIAEAIRQGDARARLGSPVKHTGFARLA